MIDTGAMTHNKKNLPKAQILQRAGTSVLAQANQTSQGVLSLLG